MKEIYFIVTQYTVVNGKLGPDLAHPYTSLQCDSVTEALIAGYTARAIIGTKCLIFNDKICVLIR
jgi:hypothetical protein